VRVEIVKAAQWGRLHNVPVWCGEFGALKTWAKPEHRRAWLRDVRAELEAHGIGWTHWDYAGDFGIVSGPRGQREPDALSLEALGLPGPPDLTLDPRLKAPPPKK
jgi:endoglucanase